MSDDTLMTDRDALSGSSEPGPAIHREAQRQAIAGAVDPILQGHRPKTLLLHGPSGAGKTSLARRALRALTDREPRLRTAYANCWEGRSAFTVLQTLARELGLTLLQGRISTHELLHRIERACQQRRCALVLDEVDQLQGKGVLYRLATTNAALILIANDDRILFSLDERVKSRLGPVERVHFPPYSRAELADILQQRAAHALAPQAVARDQVRRMAAAAAGNAHLALESLRVAAERAASAGRKRIQDADIDAAVENARHAIRTKSQSRLNREQRLLHRIVTEHGAIAGGDLHREYRARSAEPVTARAVRNYLRKLAHYGFIRVHGTGRWRTYSSR